MMSRQELTRRTQQQARRRRLRRDRRGVLLMIVLSMLALFLLLGTAYLISSNQYRDTAKQAAKLNRVNNDPTDLLERAMLQVLRDTSNPHSAVRYHSLLRDVYGSDGFVARVFVPTNNTQLLPQYAGANLPSNTAGPLGTTQGQLIDIFMMDDADLNPPVLEAAHVIELETDATGMPVDHTPSFAKDYHKGSLLTMLEGPAAGQTTRIVSYEQVGYADEDGSAFSVDGSTGAYPVWRLRVMAFAQQNGTPLTADTSSANELAELIDFDNGRGHAFMVNGRAHNGTGVGYNRLAANGQPRLNAVEVALDATGKPLDAFELALTPNSQFMYPFWFNNSGVNVSNLGFIDPSTGYQPFGYQAAGDQQLYTTYEGPGGSDESYDAADYQNMFLAHLPVVPRARGGVMDGNGVPYEIDSPDSENPLNSGADLRFDLDSTILPSFHRPALVNYWYHRLLNAPWLTSAGSPSEIAQAIITPYGLDALRDGATNDDTKGNPTTIPLDLRDQIVALKRKISLRPLPEDHPNFNGSNPLSRYEGTISPDPNATSNRVTNLAQGSQIRFPFWEAVGPWDVDNDNDGINDSVWLDLGDPVQQTEDGRLYKPLYAFLIADLDGRLNLNAHGSTDHLAANNFDPTGINLAGQATSNRLPHGLGWGPGDISLRPVLSPTTQPLSEDYEANFVVGNVATDDYARLFGGRVALPNNNKNVSTNAVVDTSWGRLGSQANSGEWRPGRALVFDSMGNVDSTTRERRVPFDFYGYPVTDPLRTTRASLPGLAQPSNFGSSPDLYGRYAIGVDYRGQPVYEATWDDTAPFVPLVDDSPYEVNLMSNSRRGMPSGNSGNDDAPFATAELERLLRAYDPESGTAPSRIWELVDAFDPNKYLLTVASDVNNVSPEELALAQSLTAINRRQVTTDSYEIPTPADVVPSYITELGPDGVPGNPGDDPNTAPGEDFNDPTEVGWHAVNGSNSLYLSGWSDDFASLTGKSVAQARLIDVVWYRIQRDRLKQNLPPFNFNNPTAIAELNRIAEQLLPPEVLAGYKMDLNRPFGDGRDNNGNGVVDEPLEAGEPFWDLNNNGVWDGNGSHPEPFLDLDGDGEYDLPLDHLWAGQPGIPASGVAVANAMGQDVAENRNYDLGGLATFRDDAHLARQLYARHLYCLMLLLMDEEYLAPYDENNPQVRRYLRLKQKELKDAGMSGTEAEIEARRRYTCRQVAQWAANCCDFRDSDALMTPFEYDENPWDGWGCTSRQGFNPNYPPSHFTPDGHPFYALDSDPATDENHRQVVNWGKIGSNGQRVIAPAQPLVSNQLPDPRDRTRNLVWGAERPELLITETLAFHDRRTEDLESADDDGHKRITAEKVEERDEDLDQRLRPQGSLFVELYNPWSQDGQRPAELYRDHNAPHWVDRNGDGDFDDTSEADPLERDRAVEGVLLNKLSDRPDRNNKQSPVWRIAVVEEEPTYRSPLDEMDDQPVTVDRSKSNKPWDEYKGPGGKGKVRYRAIDPDWDEMFQADRVPKLSTPQSTKAAAPDKTLFNYDRQQFAKPYPYYEREFYFVSPTGGMIYEAASKQRQYTDLSSRQVEQIGQDINLRLPLRAITTDGGRSLTSRFLAESGKDTPVEIAPVLPGCYAVIGSAGTRYDGLDKKDLTNGTTVPRFVTTMGRLFRNDIVITDAIHVGDLDGVRRFELLPSPNPFLQQVQVGPNGADPRQLQRSDRANELFVIQGPTILNAFDSENDTMDGNVDEQVVAPCIAMPVDDMNVSEPIYGYEVRERELSQLETQGTGGLGYRWDPKAAKGEGAYVDSSGKPGSTFSFDNPFDLEPELLRTGTTPNYRTLHLQRLADPTLPWNPPPGRDGHEASLAVNPYRTIDSATVDLTAFNGTTRAETDLEVAKITQEHKWTPYGSTTSQVEFNKNNKQLLHFKSLERGAHALAAVSDAKLKKVPLRALWPQETSNIRDELKKSTGTHRDLKSLADRAPSTDPDKDLLRKIATEILDQTKLKEHQFDMVLEHTLGFANQSVGRIIHARDPALDAFEMVDLDNDGFGDYRGAPTPDNDLGTDPDDAAVGEDSTYPWLAWNNRPFVSGTELLQVPAASSGELLRAYSTMNTELPANQQINSYDDGDSMENDKRYPTVQGHFGHLLNVFQSAAQRASAQVNNNNVEAKGAPNFHRLLDYVHVPSRFVATDTLLNPTTFSGNVTPDDPREELLAPFNRLPTYREPGKVNLNTMTGHLTSGVWSSEVYDGLMHRVQDGNTPDHLGHLGPAWRDVVLSRRGYNAPVERDVELTLDNTRPTFFANPFRAPSAGDLVPLGDLLKEGAEASLLRSHPFRPGNAFAWGNLGEDNANFQVNDATEAGLGDDVGPFPPAGIPAAPVPLFSDLVTETSLDAPRNPAVHYNPLTRLGNLTTTRSGVFAVWVTVGYFEVSPAPEYVNDSSETNNTAEKFLNQTGGDDDRARELYRRVYPQGYQLGRELDSETGDVRRQRGFYIIDRTRPVAFKPGEDVNVEDAILLRRRIE